MKTTLLCLVIITLLNLSNSLYFDLKEKSMRCFIEELYYNNMAMIKYSVKGLVGSDEENQEILGKISIKTTLEEAQQISYIDKILASAEGKFSMTADKDGQFRVCVYVFEFNKNKKPKNLQMHIQIISDNMDDPNLSKAVNKEEISNLDSKLSEVVTRSDKYNSKLEKLIKLEDKDAENIIKSQKMFYYMTLIQIILVIVIGAYQIFNLRKYLDSHLLDF